MSGVKNCLYMPQIPTSTAGLAQASKRCRQETTVLHQQQPSYKRNNNCIVAAVLPDTA